MHELFNRPISELTHETIACLIERQEAENQYLEFKADPPGNADTWQKAAGDLADELVAFANADGGLLILGVVDQDNQATEVNPIQNADSTADALHRSFTLIIDPYPVGLEVKAVDYK